MIEKSSRNMGRRILLAIVLIAVPFALSSCFLVDMIVGTATIHVTNNYNQPIANFYCTASTDDSWGSDLLHGPITSQTTDDVTVPAGTVDMLIKFATDEWAEADTAIIERDHQYTLLIDATRQLTCSFDWDSPPGPASTPAVPPPN